MKAILSVAYILLILLNSQLALAEFMYQIPTSKFDSVKIVQTTGQVKVVNSLVKETAYLNLSNKLPSSDCVSKFEIKDRVLYISNEKKLFVIKSDCSQKVELLVHPSKLVNISMGLGEIEVIGEHRAISADLGSGQIDIAGHVNKLDLNVGAGNVNVKGLDGYGSITLLSGDLNIEYEDTKEKLNQLFISKSVGNTKIKLPKGAKAESVLKTLLGNVSNSTQKSKTGEFFVSVKTNLGDINLLN